MPALRKPHRVAFLVPDVTVEGADVVHEHEVALLFWTACIEVCQRHPGLAVYDPDSTPLYPQEGHFTPQHAAIGATPVDPFFGPTRRDELVWLELSVPKPGAVRLHTLARDGIRQSFDALGKNLGEQIHQVLGAWLTARGLGPLPQRFDAVTGDEVISVIRVIAPVLVEHARARTLPTSTAPTWTLTVAAEPDGVEEADEFADRGQTAADADADDPGSDAERTAAPKPTRTNIARPIANRLPAALKLPALRLLQLALREDLDDLVLAVAPDHPQALFARFRAGAANGPPQGQPSLGPDFTLLRRVIAAAPCWANPYAELVRAEHAAEDSDAKPVTPTELESVAGAGIAALCRPAHLDVIETVAELLDNSGLVDEGVRLLERVLVTHHDESRAHIALLDLLRETDREGAWLAQAFRSGRVHGCPMEPSLPWYPDQIQIDLFVADAMMRVGRLDEAIALRGNRLEGREATWPRHTRILGQWKKDPRFVAWCFGREGYFRGDPARTVEGFGRIEPGDDIDVAVFLEALVAMGREDEVLLAWAQFGLGDQHCGPAARLAAARALMSAGEWRRGLDEMWRVELTEPGRDEHVAIARCGLLLSGMPLEIAELALGERVAIGASSLARRMARDIADFVPAAVKSSVISRALGKPSNVAFDPAWLGGFAADTRSRRALDRLFTEFGSLGSPERTDKSPFAEADLIARADKLVNRWLEVVFTEASEEDPAALAQAAAYAAAQALGRYLAATTQPANPIAGALRTVAGEALALVRKHRHVLGDREARSLLAAIDPILRRVDRWIGSAWLATVERSCAVDERSGGDVAGFARDAATVAARILGPEESAVLAASIARLHRERPDRWAAAVTAQASQLALHTGYLGAEEWADATVVQLAAREIDVDDAIDTLHTACYLVEGVSAGPCVHAARVLLDAGRGPAALAVLTAGLGAATPEWRDRQLASLADGWSRIKLDIPLAFEQVAAGMFEALQKGDPARAEKLGRWAVAMDPTNGEAHRNLGLALAHQGKVADALVHLMRATREQATQILSGVLYQTGKLPEAMAVLDYASRWYVRADQWLTYGGIAYAAMDNPRTVKSYALAYQLDPDAFDATQLNAYAGVLDEVGDYVTCEKIANHLLRVAGDDIMWMTNAWNHLACAYIGQARYIEAEKTAQDAVTQNPLPDNTAAFATTLERARTKTKSTPTAAAVVTPREPVYGLLEAGDFATASVLVAERNWRVRRAALEATRFRFTSENDLAVAPRALAAATAALAETVGLTEREPMLVRALAMQIREQAYFARDPVPGLGDRMTRDAFYTEFRARGGVVLGEPTPPAPPFKDRVVIPGGKIERVSDYVSLLRDLAALTPAEALAQFDLDEAGYLEVASAWAVAMQNDPSVATSISAGLAKR